MVVFVHDELLECERVVRAGAPPCEFLFVIGVGFGIPAAADELQEQTHSR